MKESITKQSSKFPSVVSKEGIKSLTQTGINHEEIAEMMPSFEKLRGTLNARKAKKYVLLKRKDYETYCELIKFIKELASKKNIKINPKIIMTDFELAASKAFEFQFPNAEEKGCYFLFRQSVRRWVITNGLKKNMMTTFFF
ncbi:unnamed protein product, partial [Brachionus calyciflorus]